MAASPAGPTPPDDAFAAALRGFGPVGILAIVVAFLTATVPVGGWVVPVGAPLVLAWAWRSRTPWRAIGYGRPASWPATVAIGIVFGVAFKLAMKAVVMPLLGAPAINPAYHHLAGNTALLPSATWAMIVAGFTEETLFRGFLFERAGKLFGTGALARTLIVVLSSLWFGLDHYAVQGLAGTQQATIAGLLYGTILMVTGRVWTIMIAHSVFDLSALAIIYWDLEAEVAHFFFK